MGHQISKDRGKGVPPRIRWVRAGVRCVFITIIGLSALRWYWGYEANRRLNHKIEAIRSRDEPLLMSDFDRPAPPAERNAALKYMEAVESLALTQEQQNYLQGAVAVTPAHEVQINAEITLSAEASLALIREAGALPEVDWGFRPQGFLNFNLPSNTGSRQLARILRAAARHYFDNANHVEAMGAWHDMLLLSRAVGHNYLLVSQLTAIGIDSLAYSHIEDTLPQLTIEPTRRVIVSNLISTLNDESSLQLELTRALNHERAFQLEMILAILDQEQTLATITGWVPRKPTVAERLIDYPISPLYAIDGCLLLDRMSELVAIAREDSWTSAKTVLDAIEQDRQAASITPSSIVRHLLPSMNQALKIYFRSVVTRRMVATGLAMRLFELDHGQQPEALDELVPEYLPAIPKDPFSPEGQPILYRQSPYVMLYSVGLNGLDDHGHFAYTTEDGTYVRELDYVFFLDGKRDQARSVGGLLR